MEMKKIEGFENYFVTSCGKVISTKNDKQIELKFDVSGKSKKYKRVTLSNGKRTRFPVHRLVALAFISNPDNKPQVNHIDGNPDNNHYTNLEWVTQSENMLHAYKTGLQTPQRNFIKLTLEDIPKIFHMRESGMLQREIAEVFNVSREHIKDILNKKKCRI